MSDPRYRKHEIVPLPTQTENPMIDCPKTLGELRAKMTDDKVKAREFWIWTLASGGKRMETREAVIGEEYFINPSYTSSVIACESYTDYLALQSELERQAVAIDALKRLLEETYLHESHETGFDKKEDYVAFMRKQLNKDVEAILKGDK